MKSPSLVTIRIHLKSTELLPIENGFDFDQKSYEKNFQLPNSTADQVLSWVKPSSFEDFDSQGILAGEENGNNVYVGRTIDRDGNFVAAKIVPALESAYYTYNGVEQSSEDVERLDSVADYHWVKSNVANLADAVLVSGSYIGRGSYKDSIVVGSVDTKTNQLVGSYDGKAVNLPSYDVLIYKPEGVLKVITTCDLILMNFFYRCSLRGDPESKQQREIQNQRVSHWSSLLDENCD